MVHSIVHFPSKVINSSLGMFLWVQLVFDSLDEIYRPEDLRRTVEELPPDLEALYSRIFAGVCTSRGPQGYEGLSRIFGWISFALRPLHKVELLQGLAVDHARACTTLQGTPLEALLNHCKPFVEIYPDLTVAFVRFSVKEYVLLQPFQGFCIDHLQILFEKN